MRRARILLPAVALLALAGCGDPTVTVDGSDVEEEISTGVSEKTGTTPDVSCPETLTGEVGEEIRCTATVGSDDYGVTVTVTAVDGTDVKYSWLVDEEPGDAPS